MLGQDDKMTSFFPEHLQASARRPLHRVLRPVICSARYMILIMNILVLLNWHRGIHICLETCAVACSRSFMRFLLCQTLCVSLCLCVSHMIVKDVETRLQSRSRIWRFVEFQDFLCIANRLRDIIINKSSISYL